MTVTASSITSTVSQTTRVATLAAVVSTGGGETASSYAWDFGDGTTGTGSSTTHTYARPGAYLVTVSVLGSLGNTSSTTTQVFLTTTPAAGGPETDAPRGGALVSAPRSQRVVLTCGAGQWDEVLSRDADGVATTALLHMDPAKYGVFATSEDRRYVVSAYVRAVAAPHLDANVSVGAAFFLPTSSRASGGALYENLAFSDGFSDGFSGYSYLRLAGLNASDLTCDLLVTSAGAFPATTNLATTVKVGVFGCTDPSKNGVYKGGGTGQPLVPADVQPRPGDLILATKTFSSPQWTTAAGSWTGPTATGTKYEVGEGFYDYGATLTALPSTEVTDRVQMSTPVGLSLSWKRIEKEVTVPPGARILVPVVDVNPTASASGTRLVQMTSVMVNRSQNYVTEVYA